MLICANKPFCQGCILFVSSIYIYLIRQIEIVPVMLCDMSFCSIYVQKYFYSCYAVTEAAPVRLECALAKLLLLMLLYPLVAI
jgi:hypothetical protein